jgi:hypothetical protein
MIIDAIWFRKVEEPVITFQQQHLRTEHFGQATLYKMLKDRDQPGGSLNTNGVA